MSDFKTCDSCGEHVKSPYGFQQDGVWYSGHKRCMIGSVPKKTHNKSLPNIALTGGLRAGKDSIGSYLCERYGYTRFAFGDGLKDDFHRRYPEIPRTPKPRVGYQNHGQLMRELIHKDIWVSECFRDIKHAKSHRYNTFRA